MSDSQRVVVVGAGTMGHGIAEAAAVAGYLVTLCDVSTDVLSLAKQRVSASLDDGVARGKVAPEQRAAALDALLFSTDLDAALPAADIVIEAVPERLALKRGVFENASRRVSPGALLATNTSSLPIRDMADIVVDPTRFLGMHFFNPVAKMKLLEVVRGPNTSESAIERAVAMGRRLGKEPIVVADAPGFASSRLGIAFALEAIRMVEQGVASPEDIDKAMVLGYRHPMGPLALTDLVGLDVRLAIARGLHEKLGEVFRPPALLERLVAEGKLGQKSGQGFYMYPSV